MAVNISIASYAKSFLHANKYPSEVVGGFLIGNNSGNDTQVVDAIPVFHGAPVAPVLDIASTIIQKCIGDKYDIVGVYFANEMVDFVKIPPYVIQIAESIETKGKCVIAQLMYNPSNEKEKYLINVKR